MKDAFTVNLSLILGIILFAFSCIFLFILHRQSKAKTGSTHITTGLLPPYIMTWILGIGASTIMIVTAISIYILAPAHGAQTGIGNEPVHTAIHNIKNSPKESKINPENVAPGSIVIFYKYGCTDCEAIYKDLKTELNNISDVYWVSSESTTGASLRESYPIEEVPTGVYIRNDTLSGNVTFSKFVLYTTDKDGNTILNTDAKKGLPRLLSMKEAGK